MVMGDLSAARVLLVVSAKAKLGERLVLDRINVASPKRQMLAVRNLALNGNWGRWLIMILVVS